jgi:hypothetical protein
MTCSSARPGTPAGVPGRALEQVIGGLHLRQLYVLAERLGVRPPAPLPTDALAGLPLPEALW